MDVMREGGSVNKPPFLEGFNYSYWKARMKAFIKAIDEKAWRSILTGWTHPTTKDEKGNAVPKPEEEWSGDEDKLANNNSKALNAIFNAVDVNQFKLISMCETAKEPWDILQTAHKGTDIVNASKLQMLTTRFEHLRMEEDESIAEFNSKLCDIANEAFALGERYSDAKLVKKTLRSLPARFAYKVTAIEEAKNVEKMRLDELIGNLQTFEMNFKDQKKNRGIALQADYEDLSIKDEIDGDKGINESLALLTKNFNKMLRKINKKNGFGENLKNRNFQKKTFNTQRPEEKKRNKGIQCRECEGFGHIQAECANTLKKKSKAAMVSTWSDDSDES